MLKRILTTALPAGLAAGLVAAFLQLALVQPVLLEAELYEGGERTHFVAPSEGHDHSHDAAEPAAPEAHSHAAPASADGIDWTRDGLSVVFSVMVYAGYALLLTAAIALAASFGRSVLGAREGLLWGLAGFIAVQFAPAAGLPPELPGMAAADLAGRQIWWLGTVAATALGLALLAFGRNWAAWGAALILIAAPHVVGAPHPHEFTGPTPPELASLFAGRALGVGLAAWATLGLAAGWLWSRSRVEAPASGRTVAA